MKRHCLHLVLEKTESQVSRSGNSADITSEAPTPAARRLAVCGCAERAAGLARMGLSPVVLLVLGLALGQWATHVAAVSTFTGEGFDFMGQPGRYYSLINTPGVQVRILSQHVPCWYNRVPRSCYCSLCQHAQPSVASCLTSSARPCRSPLGTRLAWATTPVRTSLSHFLCVPCSTRTCFQDAVKVHCATLTSLLPVASLIEAVGAKVGTVEVEISVVDGDVLVGAQSLLCPCGALRLQVLCQLSNDVPLASLPSRPHIAWQYKYN